MIGIDVVDVERIRGVLERAPRLTQRVFTLAERDYCDGMADPAVHYAGTYAAKEAVAKALSVGFFAPWARRIRITRGPGGAPAVIVTDRKVEVAVSISHDGPVAIAVALFGSPAPDTSAR